MKHNDMKQKREVFPGQNACLPNNANLFPAPDLPGEYVGKEEFERAPKFLAELVHWQERFEMILQGRYHEIPPVHFEGIFTLVCNFMCPHCARRVARTEWVESKTWDKGVKIGENNTMPLSKMKFALDQAASLMIDGQMGIIWGGGDPTANPDTYEALSYANTLGLKSSFLTNGVFLNVDKILELKPILVRISLNCGTEKYYRRFHGLHRKENYFFRAISNLRSIAKRKVQHKSETLIGVSLIVDERNLEDLICAAQIIIDANESSAGGIDYVIVRPVFDYKHSDREWVLIKEKTKERAFKMVSKGGTVYEMLFNAQIPLICIKDSFEQPPKEDSYQGSNCLAYGLCGEIRHNGDVHVCSDTYGNPEYTIGNIFKSTLSDIWESDKRYQVVDNLNKRQCFKKICAHNSRGHHLNRFLHQIELKRKQGSINDVQIWASDLRGLIQPLNHSFFL